MLSYRGPNLLKEFDREIVDQLFAEMAGKGIDVRLNHQIFGFQQERDGIHVNHSAVDADGLVVDEILMAVGRIPNTMGLGLEHTQVTTRADGTIEVFGNFQTKDPSIYAVGDVTGSVTLTPRCTGRNGLQSIYSAALKPQVDYEFIPTTIFCQPNIGTLGMTEEAVVSAGLGADVYVSRFKPMKHALSGRQEQSLLSSLSTRQATRSLDYIFCHQMQEKSCRALLSH